MSSRRALRSCLDCSKEERLALIDSSFAAEEDSSCAAPSVKKEGKTQGTYPDIGVGCTLIGVSAQHPVRIPLELAQIDVHPDHSDTCVNARAEE